MAAEGRAVNGEAYLQRVHERFTYRMHGEGPGGVSLEQDR
jgi:hypothetical protein